MSRLAALAYVALTIVLTWPLVTHMGSVLPHDLGDPMLNAWILWWNAHAVPLTERWWNAPMFWPAPGATAMSENLLGLSVLATPLQWLGISAVAAYNIIFFLSFPLSALAAHALVFTLTRRHDAAAIAGLVFGFNPYRIAHLPQIQLLVAFWMPVALVALHLYITRREARWLIVFGAAWLLQALSNGYYLVFFPVLLGLWALWFAGIRDRARPFAAIAGAWAIASLPLVPLLLKYRQIHQLYGMQRDFGEIDGFGADLMSFLDVSPLLAVWKSSPLVHRPEGELFPGVTALVIVAAAGVIRFLSRRRAGRARTSGLFLIASIVFAAIALSAMLAGPWSIAIGGRTLLSVSVVAKPLSVAIAFLVLALAFEPRVVDAVRRGSPLGFYLGAALAMYLLSFGPRPRVFGELFLYEAPYSWLIGVPGYDVLRVPARFAMLGVLCLATAAGIGFAWLTLRLNRPARFAVAAIALGGVLIDSWIHTIPQPHVPPRFASLEAIPRDALVVELPLGGTEDDTGAMYRAAFHRRALVNGYSGFFPPHYEILAAALEAGDVDVIDHLAAAHPLAVVVEMGRGGSDRWTAALQVRPGVRLLGDEGRRKIFLVPPTAAPELSDDVIGAIAGGPLKPSAVAVSAQPIYAGRLFDGDIVSSWHTGRPQRGDEWVRIDLGSVRSTTGVAIILGRSPADYPRVLAIDVSETNSEWTTQWSGPTAVRAIRSSEREPREPPLRFAWRDAPARFVRLRQLGGDAKFYWSIAELQIFGR